MKRNAYDVHFFEIQSYQIVSRSCGMMWSFYVRYLPRWDQQLLRGVSNLHPSFQILASCGARCHFKHQSPSFCYGGKRVIVVSRPISNSHSDQELNLCYPFWIEHFSVDNGQLFDTVLKRNKNIAASWNEFYHIYMTIVQRVCLSCSGNFLWYIFFWKETWLFLIWEIPNFSYHRCTFHFSFFRESTVT